jgi:membrane-bound serine protease (ClpP class)
VGLLAAGGHGQDKGAAPSPVKPLYVMRIEGAISPATAEYLASSIARAKAQGAQALLVELDTPGGLGDSMRTMIKDIMNAPLPIIVYVAPSGAQAASAGVFVTLAADVAAMAPGTNIGAAHPVSSEGKDIQGEMAKKVVNDMVALAQSIAKQRGRNADWAEKAVRQSISASAGEALKLNVVDLMAESRQDLLNKLDGRRIKREGLDVVLNTRQTETVFIEEGLREKILKALANPNIAYILMMIGLAGLYFELSNPGAVLPGVVGGICLILAFYAFQTLPVNFAGVLLIILAIILFILEIKIASYGLLSIGGLIALVLGSLMLFRSPEEYMRVSLEVLLPTALVVGGFFVVVTWLVVKARIRTSTTGPTGMLGLKGPVKEWDGGLGKVLVNGELWKAVSGDELEPGDQVEVLAVDGLTLTVRKAGTPA